MTYLLLRETGVRWRSSILSNTAAKRIRMRQLPAFVVVHAIYVLFGLKILSAGTFSTAFVGFAHFSVKEPHNQTNAAKITT